MSVKKFQKRNHPYEFAVFVFETLIIWLNRFWGMHCTLRIEMQQISKQVMLVPRTGMCWNFENETSKAGSFGDMSSMDVRIRKTLSWYFWLLVFNGYVVGSSLRHQFVWHVSSKPRTFFFFKKLEPYRNDTSKRCFFLTRCGCFFGRWSLEYPFWGESHNTNVW